MSHLCTPHLLIYVLPGRFYCGCVMRASRAPGLTFESTTVVGLDISEDQHSVTHSSVENERESAKHKAHAVATCSTGTLEWMFTVDKATLGDECVQLGTWRVVLLSCLQCAGSA